MVLRGPCAWRGAAVVVVFTVVGCTSSGRAASPTPSNPSPTTSHSPAEASGFVRDCGTSVSGNLGAKKQWERSSVVVGPFALVWIRHYAPPGAMNFSQPVAKVLALVKQGHQVALWVPKGERRDVTLIYNLSKGTAFPDGNPLVTFQACEKGNASWASATQFNGGIYVAHPMCVTLFVSTHAEQDKAIRVPFGLNHSACA